MKKISDEEAQKLPLKGHGKATLVYDEIFNLRKGENLVVEPKDWKRKDTPGRICRYLEKKFPNVKYKIIGLKDKQGWWVKRIA